MTVQINFEKSSCGSRICNLVLENPEKNGGDNLGTFRGYATGQPDDTDETWWRWENPNEPLAEVTFSPSLILHWGDTQMFHIFVRDGEVEHCPDCQCGCKDE